MKENLYRILLCEWCKEEFVTDDVYSRKFCSDKCRYEYQKAVTKGRIRVKKLIKICKWCGNKFETEGWKHHNYCSKQCGLLGNGKRRREERILKVKEFIEINTNKHLCDCGCGNYITVTESHYPDSIPKFIQHHYCKTSTAKEIVRNVHTNKEVSDETRVKMGLVHKGNTYRKGTTNTPDHNEKIAKALTGNTNAAGIVFTAERCKNISDGNKRFRDENPGIWRGSDAHNWKGGLSFEPYCDKFNDQLKQQIRDQYNNCDYFSGLPDYICNVLNGKVWKLDVHHVDYDKMQGCEGVGWKLVPLSRLNHSKTQGNRSFWKRLICYALEYDEMYYL